MPRQALVVHEQQLHRLIEGDLVLPEETDAVRVADAPDARLDAVRIHRLRRCALKTHQHRSVGAMTQARQRQRPVETHRDLLGGLEQPVALKAEHELARRPHRSHGVGTGGSDADLEDVKDTERHGSANLARRPGHACGDFALPAESEALTAVRHALRRPAGTQMRPRSRRSRARSCLSGRRAGRGVSAAASFMRAPNSARRATLATLSS